MTNIDNKELAIEAIRYKFMQAFCNGGDDDDSISLKSYEDCISHTSKANLKLVSTILNSDFEPKLFAKKAVEGG